MGMRIQSPRSAIVYSDINVELSAAPIDPEWILEGSPSARNSKLCGSYDGLSTIVVWDCTPGKFIWRYFEDETILVLSGRIVLEDSRGVRRLGPGDVAFFPSGAEVKWSVEEHVRKLAFLHLPVWSALGLVQHGLRKMRKLRERLSRSGRLLLKKPSQQQR
jgi:uncharacterized cupin superfamily protein